jgi:hypothetical protein
MSQRPKAETVYAVEEFYDGPESGYANFRGHPHRFEVVEERTSRSRTIRLFRLHLVGDDLLRSVLEQQRLWSRWNARYRKGEVSGELPYLERVLPDDLESYRALGASTSKYLAQLPKTIFYAEGRFFSGRRTTEYRAFGENLRVIWTHSRAAA